MKKVIAEQFVKNGYLADVKLEDAKPRGVLVVTINEKGTNSTINEITRISKPGRRVYVGSWRDSKGEERSRFGTYLNIKRCHDWR
ncbi:30S ribosomal protein S8 [Candidatus Minimicrobia naudis]